jgi:hypothetical protein
VCLVLTRAEMIFLRRREGKPTEKDNKNKKEKIGR